MSIWGKCNEDLVSAAKIAVVADAVYNNPGKGRALTQPGIQAWLPMLCVEKNMEDIPVAFSTWRKLCSCPLKYNRVHETGKCTKTFPSEIAMGSSEKDMGADCAFQVGSGRKLKIGCHIAKGVSEPMLALVDRQRCSRHLTKSLRRNIMKCHLECSPGPTEKLCTKQKRNLAKFIEKPVAWEFHTAHQMYGRNINHLISVCESLKGGTLACIQGDGVTCTRVSLVCEAHEGKGCNSLQTCLPLSSTFYSNMSQSSSGKLVWVWVEWINKRVNRPTLCRHL